MVFKNFHSYFKKSLLAVDFGSHTMGLATFTVGRDPYPLGYGSLSVGDALQVEESLRSIIVEEQIDYIIFGLPLLADGKEGQMAQKVKSFAHGIAQKSGVSVLFQDEYLSSYEAQERIRSLAPYGIFGRASRCSQEIDKESAKIILEDFMRSSGVI